MIARGGGAEVHEQELDALINDLEAAYELHEDGLAVRRDLLDQLPGTAATWAWRARLTLLDVDALVRDHGVAEAAVAVVMLRDEAAARGERALQARASRALAWLFLDTGDTAAGLEHAVAALALDGDDLDAQLRCKLRVTMAVALHDCGMHDAAREHYREALEQAKALERPHHSMTVLNNWAYTELSVGRLHAASALIEELQRIAEHHAIVLDHASVGTVAEVLHSLGRSCAAITMLRQRLDADRGQRLVDVVGCWLDLARIERETGDLDAAGSSLDTADRLTANRQVNGLRVEGIGARAELLAARGDHAGAYREHLRFHAETLALSTATAEARAQTLHAMFEVDAARGRAARYREMSYRDPLTDLYNRRHVDEDLDRRLAHGEGLAVAMIDLDHFKRVNDTLSHDAGDAVLARLATLLNAAADTSPGAYAARLGGEEFLLVLPHHDLAAAHTVAETLRHQIETSDWHDITPGISITASTGLAISPLEPGAQHGRADLLRQADIHLYAAKHSGRNRVEPTPVAPGPHGGG